MSSYTHHHVDRKTWEDLDASIKIPVEYGVHSHIQRECSRGPIRETSPATPGVASRTPRRAARGDRDRVARSLPRVARSLSRLVSNARRLRERCASGRHRSAASCVRGSTSLDARARPRLAMTSWVNAFTSKETRDAVFRAGTRTESSRLARGEDARARRALSLIHI